MRARAALSLLLVSLVAAQPCLAASAESSVWTERRRGAAPRPVQVAALPRSQAILSNLPAPSVSLAGVTRSSVEAPSGRPVGPLAALAQSVPLDRAVMGETSLPAGASQAPVMIVQDVHLHAEAQRNIAAVLDRLAGEDRVDVVGVEGAFERFDFARFLAFKNDAVRAEVGAAFLDRSLIAAPAYVALTSKKAPAFVGLDEPGLYAANVAAYLSSQAGKAEALRRLETSARAATEAKRALFPPALVDFDGLREAYHAGNVPVGAYIQRLSALAGGADLEIEQFLAAYAIEKSLDFKKVDAERRAVVEQLARRLTGPEIEALVARTVAYRAGRLGFGAYYRELKALCQRSGVSLGATPNFDAYVRYVLLSDGIHADKLFKEMAAAERRVVDRLAATPEQKDLARKSELIGYARKLVDFSLTPDEWELYRSLRSPPTDAELSLAPFEAFYERADERSRAMVDTLLAAKSEKGRAIIVGGFHTPLILRLLRERKVPAAVVSPRITKVDLAAGTAYLSIFAREKASLEHLFKGRALFLSPIMVAGVGTSAVPAAERSDHLAASLAAKDPTAPGYRVSEASDGFVRVRNEKDGLDLEVDPRTYEKRAPAALAFRPASLFDAIAKRVASTEAAYKRYTAFIAPLIETPLFAAAALLMAPAAGALGLDPATGGVVLGSLVMTLLHALLNRDFSARSLSAWFIGGVAVSAPFAMPSVWLAAAASLAVHTGWNSVAAYAPASWRLPYFLRVPLSLLGFQVKPSITGLESMVQSRRALMFADDPGAVDAELAARADAEKRPYQRVALRDQSDLNRMMTSVTVEDGEIKTSDGPLATVIKDGGIAFIDYHESSSGLVEGFNSLYDRGPYYDKYTASDDLSVVGALNPSDVRQHPVSFYSRFRRVASTRERMPDPLTRLTAPPAGVDADVLELYEQPALRYPLVGRHRLIENGRAAFDPGPLARAIDALARRETPKPIVIRGANWDDPGVADFMRQLIVRGEVEINGKVRKIPAGLQIYREPGNYATRPVTGKSIEVAQPGGAAQGTWVVNRRNFDGVFFGRSEIAPDGSLVERPGLADAGQPLRLLISDELPDWVWHRLMHGTDRIALELVPGVAVPAPYQGLVPVEARAPRPAKAETLESMKDRPAYVVESPDLDFALAQVRRQYPGQEVAIHPVTSETKLRDLIAEERISIVGGRRVFTSVRKPFLQDIFDGKVVVLEGLDANPALFQQLETLLHGAPYVVENNQRIYLKGRGRVIITARPSNFTSRVGSVKAVVTPTAENLREALAAELGERFERRAGDWNKIVGKSESGRPTLEEIFATVPAPAVPGTYPVRPNFSMERLRMLFSYDDWLEGFENVFISDYADAPEVAAFLRVAVRATFNVSRPGQADGTVDAWHADKALGRLVPSVPQDSTAWQAADAVSTDLLLRNNVELDFTKPPMGILTGVVAPALAKAGDADRRAYYARRFRLQATAIASAPALDTAERDLPADTRSERDRTARGRRVTRAMKLFNAVFLKGSPGTGKSYEAFALAAPLGYAAEDVVGPITVGPDMTESDLVSRTFFNGKETETIPEAIAIWAKKKRGLLIIDEANLAEPSLWNVLRNRIDENHQVIFTGNQEFLAGRRTQTFLRDRVVTVPFDEFDEDFVRKDIRVGLAADKKQPDKLTEMLLGLTEIFRGMGRDKAFSLRDVRELVARVNEFTPANWTPESVIVTAWRQYEGIFNEDERQALRHLIARRYGIDVKPYIDENLDRIIAIEGERFAANGVTLVRSAARTVRAIDDFLRLRDVRSRGDSRVQGKRGMIFEGPSGRGKDLLLLRTLDSKGFMDASNLKDGDPASDAAKRDKKVYIRVNASRDFGRLLKAIAEAQEKGWVVIVSEMNLLPSAFLEGKLNDILTSNRRPEFAFFATINSEAFGGREKLSTALQNRVVYQKESDYTQDELRKILDGEAKRAGADAALSSADRELIVNAHAWIRDQLPEDRFHPTTRQIVNVVALVAAGRPVREAIDTVYGPVFLDHFLDNRDLPPESTLRKYEEKPRVDNVRVLTLMGSSLLPAGKPFSINVDPSDPNQTGGYYMSASNAITMRAAAFDTPDWQDTFWHEASHGLFTRDFDGFEALEGEADPLYQDLEDLRHEAAFDSFFPASRLDVPSDDEARLAGYIKARNAKAILSWMNASGNGKLSPRHLFSYAIMAYAKGIVSEEGLRDMAEVFEGISEVNPFALAYKHRERAAQIRKAIPKTMHEDEIRFQQHRALVLMSEMVDDYLSMLDIEDVPPALLAEEEREERATEAVKTLRNAELNPLANRRAPVVEAAESAPSGEDLEALKRSIAGQRKTAKQEAAAAAKKALVQIRRDLRARRISNENLNDIIGMLTTETHRYSVLRKIRLAGAASLEAEALALADRAKARLNEPAPRPRSAVLKPVGIAAAVIAMLSAAVYVLANVRWSFDIRSVSFGFGGDASLGMVLLIAAAAGALAYLAVRFRVGPRLSVPARLARALKRLVDLFPTDDVTGSYGKSTAHSARQSQTHDPRPIETIAVEMPVSPWKSPFAADDTLRDISKTINTEIDNAFYDFVARKGEPKLDYGPTGIFDIGQYIIDPGNAYLSSSSRETQVKKQVVVLLDGNSFRHIDEPVNFLVENGFTVWAVRGSQVSEAQLEKLRRNGPVQVIRHDELWARVEPAYLYGALRRAMEAEEESRELSLDEQAALAASLAADTGGPAQTAATDLIFSVNLSGSRLSDLAKVGRLTRATELDLTGVRVYDLAPLAALTNLIVLKLGNVPARNLAPLLALSNLGDLVLDFSAFTRDELESFVLRHPNFISLTVRDATTGETLTAAQIEAARAMKKAEAARSSAEVERAQLQRPGFLGGTEAKSPGVVVAGDVAQIDLRGVPTYDLSNARGFSSVTGLYVDSLASLPVDDLLALPNLASISVEQGGMSEDAIALAQKHPNRENLVFSWGGIDIPATRIPAQETSFEEQMAVVGDILDRMGVPRAEHSSYLWIDSTRGTFQLHVPRPIEELAPFRTLTRMTKLLASQLNATDVDSLLGLPRLAELYASKDLQDRDLYTDLMVRHPNRGLQVGSLESNDVLVEFSEDFFSPASPATAATAREVIEARLKTFTHPDSRPFSISQDDDALEVDARGLSLRDTDLNAITSPFLWSLALQSALVSDLTSLRRSPNLALLTLTNTRVTLDEVYYLLHSHPNGTLVVVHNGTRYTRANLPTWYLPRRGKIAREPLYPLAMQLDIAAKLLEDDGVSSGETKQRVLAATDMTGGLALKFARLPADEELLRSLGNLNELEIPQVTNDRTVLVDLLNLQRLTIKAPTSEEAIYDILTAHPNRELKIEANGRTWTRQNVPPGYLLVPLAPELLERETEWNAQLGIVKRFLEKLNSTAILDLDDTYPTKESFSLKNARQHGSDALVWNRARRILLVLPNNSGVKSLAGLRGVTNLKGVDMIATDVENLRGLEDAVALEELRATNSKLVDISALSGKFRLRNFLVGNTPLADITPLKSHTSLKHVDLTNTNVRDLMPLHGIPLEGLTVNLTAVTQEEIEVLVAAHPDPSSLMIGFKGGTFSGSDFLPADQRNAALNRRLGITTPAPAAPAAPATLTPFQAAMEIMETLSDADKALAYVSARFKKEGREAEGERMVRKVLDALSASLQGPGTNAAAFVPTTKTPPNAPPAAPPTTRPNASEKRRNAEQPADLDQIAESIVEVALAANDLDAQRAAAGGLVGALLAGDASGDIHLQDLVTPARGPSFGALLANPYLDESALLVRVAEAARRRGASRPVSAARALDGLYQTATMGLPSRPVGALIEAELGAEQVVMVVRGIEDVKKAMAVRKALKGKKELVLIKADQVLDGEGRVSLATIDLEAQRQTGNGLRGSLLVLPDGLPYASDVSEDLLRTITIATINNLLQGTVMSGPSLINLDRIARLVAMSA